jgi:hypothetical protein
VKEGSIYRNDVLYARIRKMWREFEMCDVEIEIEIVKNVV